MFTNGLWDKGSIPGQMIPMTQKNGTWYYLPTPPLGQDMTQGQFLSGV